MLKEKRFQEYRKDYKRYEEIPKEQDKIKEEIKGLKAQEEQAKQETKNSHAQQKRELQQQYDQYIENSQNQEYINQEYLRRFPDLNKQELDLNREIEEYDRNFRERAKGHADSYQNQKEELGNLHAKTEAARTSLEQELSKLQVPEVFDEEAFRKQRQYELEHMPQTVMLSTDVDLTKKYEAEIEREVISVINQPEVQEIFHGLQQGLFPEKIENVMKKPFQPDIYKGVTGNGLRALVSRVERLPQKPEERVKKEINREEIVLSYPIPKGMTIVVEWIIPLLVAIFAFFLLGKVNFNILSFKILKIIFIIALTVIGIGIGARFGRLATLLGGAAGFLISQPVSIKLANLMQGGVSVVIKAILALAVFSCVKILLSTYFIRKIEQKIVRIFLKSKEESLRDMEYQRLVNEQERMIQEYQNSLQQYERKMQYIETLENDYYNLAHYREIVTLVLEQERAQMEVKEKAEREAANKQRVLERKKKEEDYVAETEVLIKTHRANNAKERERIQSEIVLKRQMLKEKGVKLEEISGELKQAGEEYERVRNTMQEEAKIKREENDNKLEELKSRIASRKQEIKMDECERAKQKEEQIQEAEKKYQIKVQEIEQEYAARITGKEKEIENLSEMRKKLFEQMQKNLHELGSNLVGYEESKGVLSNYLYFCDSDEKNPKWVYEIKHCKKPIVFLYRRADSTAVAQSLREFITMINMAFLSINCIDIYDSIVSDPVAQATWFGEDEQNGLIRINNSINSLYEEIHNLRIEVGKTSEKNIDNYNRGKAEKDEDVRRCLKYKVVQFLVPEQEAAANTDFFSPNFWGTLQASAENGFLPIFYINEEDWKVALSDESRFNGKFVKSIVNNMGGDMKNVYIADAKKLSIEPYEKE